MENNTAHKLVTIRQIDKIIGIPNADLIVNAKVGGWSLIVKKDEVNVGDKVVLFEVDSFIPLKDSPVSDYIQFLEKDAREYNGINGVRIKTKKLKGTLSQGLALPLSLFPELANKEVGDEVTEYMKVIKYDNATVSAKSSTNAQFATTFPHFIKKTDCERIQNFGASDVIDVELMTQPLDVTVKYDGTSLTAYVLDNQDVLKTMNFFQCKFMQDENGTPLPIPEVHVGICSRNLEIAPNDTSVYMEESKKHKLKEILLKYNELVKQDETLKGLPKNIAIQGEIIGNKINGNFEKISGENEIHIFNLFDIDNQMYASFDIKTKVFALLQSIAKENDVTLNFVKQVENVEQGKSIIELIGLSEQEYMDLIAPVVKAKQKIENMYSDKDKIPTEEQKKELYTEYNNGIQQLYEPLIEKAQEFFLSKADGEGYKQNRREGIVMKTHDGKYIFKAISNAYLLKYEL